MKIYGMPLVDKQTGHVWTVTPVTPGMSEEQLEQMWLEAKKESELIIQKRTDL